jgi:hypothetical protein
LLQLAGSMLAEISLPKLVVVWFLLIGLPGLLLGGTPLLASVWMTTVLSKAFAAFAGIWSVPALILLVAGGWLGGRRLLRLAESSFWSLSALAIQPAYVLFREGFRHLVEVLLTGKMGPSSRAKCAPVQPPRPGSRFAASRWALSRLPGPPRAGWAPWPTSQHRCGYCPRCLPTPPR